MSRVFSIDPGTRNLAICVLDYDISAPSEAAATMEQFLSRISLVRLGFADLGTDHANTCTIRFKSLASEGGQWCWVTQEYNGNTDDVVIELQGSQRSSSAYLCFCFSGFFLGLQAARGTRGSCYLNYPAANKFRGDWILVQTKSGSERAWPVNVDSGDPVKTAAVELCGRLVTHFRQTEQLVAALELVNRENRKHDMSDCVLQGVSYLFKKHIQRLGSTTQRARPSVSLPVENPDPGCLTEELLKRPRTNRIQSKRSTAVRAPRENKKKKKKQEVAAIVSSSDHGWMSD